MSAHNYKCKHATTIYNKRDHNFKREQQKRYIRMVRRESKGGGKCNDITISNIKNEKITSSYFISWFSFE